MELCISYHSRIVQVTGDKMLKIFAIPPSVQWNVREIQWNGKIHFSENLYR